MRNAYENRNGSEREHIHMAGTIASAATGGSESYERK